MLQAENPFNFFDWNVSVGGGAAGGGGNAGGDDDDDFGDFKFVPAASSVNNHRHAGPAPPPLGPSPSNSDDEWGDFVDCFPSDSFPAAPLSLDPFPGTSIIDPSGTNQSPRDPKPTSPVGGVSSRPIPLSIFGEDEPVLWEEASMPVLERSVVDSGMSPSHFSKENPPIAFKDLIANLYSQTEQMKQVVLEANLSGRVSDDEGDSDDKDWEFKDAFSDNRLDNHEVDTSLGGVHIETGSASSRDEDEESNFRDFFVLYFRLKEVGRKYVLQHLDALENERKAANLSHDQATALALNQEIQAGYAMLQEEEKSLSTGSFEDHPLRNAGEVELLRAINDLQFQELELLYCLSEKILAAKDSLGSALALFKHTTSMLCIMTLATVHEQLAYVSAWSKIISTCSKELHHGASIWRRAQENQVDKEILDDTQGVRYFLSLGEVYRISEVLKVTCELYKPWLLLNRGIYGDMTTLLKECSSQWNGAGLKETVNRICCPNLQDEENKRALLESIESLHRVDIHSVQSSMLRRPLHLCRLSLLPLDCLNGMESVLWNGQQFFLKLANLWANLISPECPRLPQIHLGK
ncbi:unnamed protein product [Victoria cruziana]